MAWAVRRPPRMQVPSKATESVGRVPVQEQHVPVVFEKLERRRNAGYAPADNDNLCLVCGSDI